MSKIKVLHHAKGISYSGTDRTMQIMCDWLANRYGDKFDVYALYRRNAGVEQLDWMKYRLGAERVIEYEHEHGENVEPYFPKNTDFYAKVKEINPDIFHAHRAGHTEWPFLPELKETLPNTKFVETHIFDRLDRFPWDQQLFICEYIASKCGRPGGDILYNPVDVPHYVMPHKDNDPLILGRIGRADNFCDISLKAMAVLRDRGIDNFIYKIVNPCPRWKEVAIDLDLLSVCEFLDPIYDNDELSRFYSTIDILAHARSDGECNSVTISEAQMHKVPVVSHESPCYNGHIDQINNSKCGFVVDWKDYVAYADRLEMLILDAEERKAKGENGFRWAMENVSAHVIAEKLVRYYAELVNV